MLRIQVNTASAEIIENDLITAGRAGLQCQFTFSGDWDDLAKTVVVIGSAQRDVVLVGDTITVPRECLLKAQFPVKIGVYGANAAGTVVIPTIWANFGKILPSAHPVLIQPDEITPNILAQIEQNSANALYLAQQLTNRANNGEFDGRDGATGPVGPQGVPGQKGDPFTYDDFTPEQLETLTGPQGPAGPAGQDGQDGQDAVVDATLSNSGEAADAAATGKVKHTADYALRFAETLNNGNGIPLDAEWLSGDIGGSRPYRAHSKRAVNTERKVLQAAAGYRFYLRIYSNGSYSDSSWYGPGYSSRKTYTLPNGADYIVVVSTNPEDTSVTADPDNYGSKVTIQNNIGSGGGSITVDSALSDSSENPVQNKIIKAALDAKGTYSKPSGGIPKTDLASAVQTSLGKADTALQTAPVSSVNGQTGAVSLSIPSTASDVGAVASNQGVSNANKVLTVNSSGAVVPEDDRFVVTMTPTSPDYSGTIDRTPADLAAAYEAGKRIIAYAPAFNFRCELSLATIMPGGVYTFDFIALGELNGQDIMLRLLTNYTDSTYTVKIYPLATGQWTGGSY